MATPKQNYARQYQAYAQSIEPDIPSSVRTYSIFNPDTGTWQRMTNGFRSPIPAQGQVSIPVQVPAQPAVDPVVQALALARQTQGRDWAMPLPQTPAQIPSGGSRRRSPASGEGTAVVPVGQGRNVAPRASQGQIPVLSEEGAVQAPSTLYQGMGKTQEGGTVYTPLVVAVDSRPSRQDIAITREGISVPSVPFTTPADVVAANIGLPPTGIQRTPHSQREFIEQLSRQENIYPTEENVGAMLGNVAMLGLTPYGLGVKGALGGVRQFADPRAYVSRGMKALPKGSGAQPMGGGAKAPGSDHWTWKAKPNARRTYSQATREAQRPVDVEWVEVTPTGPAAINGIPSRSALSAPTTNPSTGFGPIKTQANIPSGVPIRLGGYPELPPAGVGVQPMGRTQAIIRSPLEMTTPSGLARWQYRLDQLSGLR